MADIVVGWVPGPTERGTLTLLWSCVITIFACTWTVLHLNVPGRLDTSLTVALRKLKWMAINILFPEFVFSKAVCDLRLALQELREFDDYLREIDKTIEWTTRHQLSHDSWYVIRWTWEIHYPDGWSGFLYDLLRLDRPPHLLNLPAENVVRGCSPFKRFLRKFIVGPLSASTHPDNTTVELEARQSSFVQPDLQNERKRHEDRQTIHGLATEDHRQTREGQRQPGSIHKTPSLKVLQQKSLNNYAQESVGDPEGKDQARVDGANLEPAGSPDDGHNTDSRNTPSQEQDNMLKTTRNSLGVTRTIIQNWTVVHSYYAQMGGLVFPQGPHTVTASHLTRRFRWRFEDAEHPLMHLVLSKDDIEDRSKADWLLKSLAVLQITWIIMNVIVRHITGLPISQIEIATIAFAIMAVLIYLANWWKPKDISQPTTLQFHGYGGPVLNFWDRKQSFTQRILSPTSAIDKAAMGVPSIVERVANDVVWLEGNRPLLFYLMAGSSLIFGSLHCLAWNFEFPTRVELLCWRVASLMSAILPAVVLAISAILGHLAVHVLDHHFASKLSAELKLIFPVESRQLLTKPSFLFWDKGAQYALWKAPKDLRNWEVEPTASVIRHWRSRGNYGTVYLMVRFTESLAYLDHLLLIALAGSNKRTSIPSWEMIARRARYVKEILKNPELLEFWRDYEDFLGSKHPHLRRLVAGGPVTLYLQQILEVAEKVSTPAIMFKKRAERASNLVSINSLILYTAARLTILVLIFTSLRAAPAGVYQDTAWSRFLPKFS
ncbi:hypothetical protein N8I77_013513 [Diaporthe amygdali]|uniref:Uncharacterized protein n=1 Tax=Phomopsis amygdali TaxID=1214568 RepID=A0AAD9S0X0_PHOAM|nr:hypothetical protein N8I77_013513 [Diaporthe amygdali]